MAVGAVVQRVVEEAESQVRHPDLVGVGKGQREAQPDLGGVLADAAELAAHVPGRLLGREDDLVEGEWSRHVAGRRV
jgi:hypothetical protein